MPNTDHIAPEDVARWTKSNGGTEPKFVWVLQYFDPYERGPDSLCGSSLWATKELAVDGFYNSEIEDQIQRYEEAKADGMEDAEELNPNVNPEFAEQLAKVSNELVANGEAYNTLTDLVVRLFPMPIYTTA